MQRQRKSSSTGIAARKKTLNENADNAMQEMRSSAPNAGIADADIAKTHGVMGHRLLVFGS